MNISTTNFKLGITIEVNKHPYTVIWFQNHKPGKGGSVIRVKLQHFINKSFIDRTFKSGERFKLFNITSQKKQYIYKDKNNQYNFLDLTTYEQVIIPVILLGKAVNFIKEGSILEAKYLNDKLVSIELPIVVNLKVRESENGVKGDSISNTTKIVTLE
ncbi:MAG: elongation factor P, partial [Endomicrobium sp.]|nr:elongation factor P [Endomicrobium sp.]